MLRTWLKFTHNNRQHLKFALLNYISFGKSIFVTRKKNIVIRPSFSITESLLLRSTFLDSFGRIVIHSVKSAGFFLEKYVRVPRIFRSCWLTKYTCNSQQQKAIRNRRKKSADFHHEKISPAAHCHLLKYYFTPFFMCYESIHISMNPFDNYLNGNGDIVLL